MWSTLPVAPTPAGTGPPHTPAPVYPQQRRVILAGGWNVPYTHTHTHTRTHAHTNRHSALRQPKSQTLKCSLRSNGYVRNQRPCEAHLSSLAVAQLVAVRTARRAQHGCQRSGVVAPHRTVVARRNGTADCGRGLTAFVGAAATADAKLLQHSPQREKVHQLCQE